MNIDALERDLPPATLLLGPDVNRMASAAFRAAVQVHRVIPADILIRRHLSAGDARTIVRFTQTAPFGPSKMVIARLDGATAQAQNILLKVLEEPPEAVRFILAASERPLPTVVSRCQVVIVPAEGTATEPDEQVTRQVTAVVKAAAAADLNGLDKALRGWDEAHSAVLSVLLAEAAAGRDPNRLLDRMQARKLLGALARYPGAHPRLAAHAAMVSVLVP